MENKSTLRSKKSSRAFSSRSRTWPPAAESEGSWQWRRAFQESKGTWSPIVIDGFMWEIKKMGLISPLPMKFLLKWYDELKEMVYTRKKQINEEETGSINFLYFLRIHLANSSCWFLFRITRQFHALQHGAWPQHFGLRRHRWPEGEGSATSPCGKSRENREILMGKTPGRFWLMIRGSIDGVVERRDIADDEDEAWELFRQINSLLLVIKHVEYPRSNIHMVDGKQQQAIKASKHYNTPLQW